MGKLRKFVLNCKTIQADIGWLSPFTEIDLSIYDFKANEKTKNGTDMKNTKSRFVKR